MIRVRHISALMLPLLLAGCTTSSSVDIEGNYLGTLTGSFMASMSFTVSGNTISGTGEIIFQEHMPWFRGTPETTHITITGTRSGKNILSMYGATNMQFRLKESDEWEAIDLTITFFGAFTGKGGLSNTTWRSDWQPPGQQTFAHGGWSGVRVKAASSTSGVLRP